MSKWEIIKFNSCRKEIVSNSVFEVPFNFPACGTENLFIQDIDGNFISKIK